MADGQQFIHGRFILTQSDQSVNDRLVALCCSQRFSKQSFSEAEPGSGADSLVCGAEGHYWCLKRVTVSFGETDLQFVLRRSVAAKAWLARARQVWATGSRSISCWGLVFELALVPIPAALPFQVELADLAVVHSFSATPTPDLPTISGSTERHIQGYCPDCISNALVEAFPIDCSQRHGFFLPLHQTLVERHRFKTIREDRFLAVVLAENLLEKLFQSGSKVPPAGLQGLFAALSIKPIPTQDETNS